jgi:ribokinase
MPEEYLQARGYHVNYGTLEDTADLVSRLRAVNPTATVVWEPSPLQQEGSADAFAAILTRVDAFTPDATQARAITGRQNVSEAAETLIAWGAPVVALRLGARGSRVWTAAGERYTVPAIPVAVVDTTGAGNAYAGGLLVGLANGVGVAEAAARAAVSASFAIEQFGVPTFDERTREIAQRRLVWARERIIKDHGEKSAQPRSGS